MYAPIVTFVYNRAEHAKGMLESLSRCKEAKESKLYIFSDGAKNEEAAEKVAAVRKYINSDSIKSRFGEVKVVEAEKNKGLAKSVITGVDMVIKKYGRVIVVEDDNEVSEDFLGFMNGALEFYEKNNKIWSIGGYTPPIKFPEDYKHDVFLMGRGSSYAWATWLDRWKRIDWDVKDYDKFKNDKEKRRAFNKYGNDRSDMLDRQMNRKIDSWAIRFTYFAFKNNMYSILPVKTRVKNVGNDGSGTHVSQSDSRFDTEIDTSVKEAVFENVELDERIYKEFIKVFNVPVKNKMKKIIKKLLKM